MDDAVVVALDVVVAVDLDVDELVVEPELVELDSLRSIFLRFTVTITAAVILMRFIS